MTARYSYPANLELDGDTILVTFDDLPGATFGDDKTDALARAVDGLETILNAYIQDREAIPFPSPSKSRPLVSPTLLGSLKLSVYEAMRGRGWRKADLSRAMGLNPRQIDRLLDLRHASTISQLETALTVCGKRAEVAMMDIAA